MFWTAEKVDHRRHPCRRRPLQVTSATAVARFRRVCRVLPTLFRCQAVPVYVDDTARNWVKPSAPLPREM